MHEVRLRFHWKFRLSFELKILQHLFRWWLGADQATSHYLNQWWLVYLWPGIMTELRGCCSSSTQYTREQGEWCSQNPSVVDVIIRPAPEGAGRTTPEQTGHYSHYNTKLTNSRYFRGNSYRIALGEPPSRPSCSWKFSEHCHPLCS